ncbi:MAG: Mn transporter [Candidatus Levybacteria bacterium RIFCSPLOWO2_01_FULL_36_13]|nr:MAG: Mn transporter [Candidatus Levybacteria bacterium RIFCSPHIGHO2_01_FULL_36_15b]OGH34926.1 MAG: Mn transporter [Candidatus Levybacteria bacterium RIFCSPLOWO2_01_FULL_36_13]
MMNLFKRKLLVLIPILAIIGPGIIAGNVDNDAAGITNYSIAGAHFGYSLLWVLFLSTFSLAVTQEIGARMGLVTGKGLGALIREKFGVKWTAFVMIILFFANLGTIAAEFAGVAASLEIFHIPRIVSVPIAAVLIYIVITKGNFKKIERLFLLLSFFYIAYILSAFNARPDFTLALKSLVVPHLELQGAFLLTMIALIGTTITPWGQFFIQDYVVDKKLSKEDLKIERGDVFLGSFLTNFFAFFIIVATAATLYTQGIRIDDAKDAALALKPLVGQAAAAIFGLGFLNASLFGALVVPLTTAYVITQAFGAESGLNFSYRQAPKFYTLIAILLIIGAGMVAIPFFPLINILVATQVVNAILLLPIFVFLYILSNDKKLLGDYANGKFINILLIVTLIAISIAAVLFSVAIFAPNILEVF